MYEQEVIQLVKSEVAFMGTIDGNRPRVRPMKPYIDEHGYMYVFSRGDAGKVDELQANPRVDMCFLGKDQEVLNIYGRLASPGLNGLQMIVLKDLMFKQIPDMKHYFTGAEDPQLVIYKFVVHEVNYMRKDCQATTRVNLPAQYDPDVELALCQGGFCLMNE